MTALAIASQTTASPHASPPGYNTVEEAAEKLRVGTRFLRDGANHHGFPHARMSGRLVFSDEDLHTIYQMFRSPVQSSRRGRRAA